MVQTDCRCSTTRQNQVLHHNNATTVWILIHMSSKTCIWNHFSIRITDTQCVWLLLVQCCHSQNRELTWACPRPRTWDAAIRSLFWLAYDEEGRDGIHDRGGREGRRGSNNKNHTEGLFVHKKNLDYTELISVISQVHAYAWAKQACLNNK